MSESDFYKNYFEKFTKLFWMNERNCFMKTNFFAFCVVLISNDVSEYNSIRPSKGKGVPCFDLIFNYVTIKEIMCHVQEDSIDESFDLSLFSDFNRAFSSLKRAFSSFKVLISCLNWWIIWFNCWICICKASINRSRFIISSFTFSLSKTRFWRKREICLIMLRCDVSLLHFVLWEYEGAGVSTFRTFVQISYRRTRGFANEFEIWRNILTFRAPINHFDWIMKNDPEQRTIGH